MESAWNACLLPEGEAVFVKQDKSYKFVLRTYRNAALVWPMSTSILQSGCRELSFNMEVSKLEWLFLFDKTSILVHPLKTKSPLRMWLEHKIPGAGIVPTSSEKPETLEAFHTARGFCGLAEDTLKKLCAEWSIPLPESVTHMKETQVLQTALLVNKKPGVDEATVKATLLQGEANLEGHDDVEVEEMEAILQDTVLSTEKDTIMKLLKSSSRKKKEEKVTEAWQKCFQNVVDGLPAAKKKEREKALAKAKAQAKAGSAKKKKEPASSSKTPPGGSSYDNRNYDPIPVQIDKLLKEAKPPAAGVYTECDNGRWKVSYSSARSHQQRSISWTSIGPRAAGKAALKQLWDWAEMYDGKPITDEAKDTLKKIQATSEVPGSVLSFGILRQPLCSS